MTGGPGQRTSSLFTAATRKSIAASVVRSAGTEISGDTALKIVEAVRWRGAYAVSIQAVLGLDEWQGC